MGPSVRKRAVGVFAGVAFGAMAAGGPISSPHFVGDYPRLRLTEVQRGELTDQKRDEVIRQLERIARRTDNESLQKAELLFQLSEFYWEKSRHLYHREMAGGDEKHNHVASERHRKRALAIYDRLLRDYPKFPRRDEVLFSVAYNLDDTGREKEAALRYEELIKAFPNSRFVADAHIQLGNFLFENNRLAPARHHYEMALRAHVPKVYSYALYKLAWCDYNAGEFEAALKKLHDVVAFAESQGRVMVDLKNEALSDLVVVYVRLDRPREAMDYFAHRAPHDRQERLLARLGGQLADVGQYQSAIRVYRMLLERTPDSPQAPDYQQALVKSYEGLRQRDQVKTEVRRLAEDYRPGSAWWRRHERDRQTLLNAFATSEEALRTLVTEYHQEAQRTQQVETYRLARDLYREYVDAFGSGADAAFVSDHAFNMLFYYAEILWTLDQWNDAAEAYKRVVAFTIPARKSAQEIAQGKYRHEAAHSAVLAYDHLVKQDRGELKTHELHDGEKIEEHRAKGEVDHDAIVERRPADGAVQPLTPHEAHLVEACDTYVDRFPGRADEIDIRYRAALALYGRNHFPEAARRFGDIILRWPEERRSQEAADLTLYVLEAQHRWGDLAAMADRFRSNPRLAKPGTEFAARLNRVLEGAAYKAIAEAPATRGSEAPRSADQFFSYAQKFPHSAAAPKALAYAMLISEEGGNLEAAREAGERLLRDYPDSPLELKARHRLAHLYERTTEFEQTPQAYEEFVAAFDRQRARKSDDAEQMALIHEAEAWVPDALFNAALWWDGVGKTDRALAAYRAYEQRFTGRSDLPEVLLAEADLLERDGKGRDAAKVLSRLVEQHAARVPPLTALDARRRRVELLWKLHAGADLERASADLAQACARLPSDAKGDVRALEAFALTRFLRLEGRWADYRKLRLDRPQSLQRDLARKQARLKELEQGYTQVLEVGAAEEGVAALSRLGMAYSDLADAILESAAPRSLTKEQKGLYREELSKLATPVKEQALAILERGLAKAYELAVYTPAVLEAEEQVNRYQPGRYPPTGIPPLMGSEPLEGAQEGKEDPFADARAKWARGDLPAARGLLEEAGRHSELKENVRRLVALAAIHRLEGHAKPSEESARHALRTSPDDPGALESLALAFAAEGRVRLAELLAMNAQKHGGTDARRENVLGVIAFQKGDVSAARAHFQRAATADASFVPAHFNLGALALAYRDYRGAEKHFAQAAQLRPEWIRAKLYRAVGLAALPEKSPADKLEAGAAFEEVLSVTPDSGDALCGAGWAYSVDPSGWERAARYLERCKALPSTSPAERQRAEAKLATLTRPADEPATAKVEAPQRIDPEGVGGSGERPAAAPEPAAGP